MLCDSSDEIQVSKDISKQSFHNIFGTYVCTFLLVVTGSTKNTILDNFKHRVSILFLVI